MPTDIRSGRVLDGKAFREVILSMALEHQKWDAQVGDVMALAPFPIVVPRGTWGELAQFARDLAAETVAMETELCARSELFRCLGLPRELERVLVALGRDRATPGASRIMRFDFHPTSAGWRVSEVNSDVPGGFTEAQAFTSLMAESTGEGRATGNPASRWVDGFSRHVPPEGTVALLSAPGWVQDTQVVAHLAAAIRKRGLRAVCASPHHLRWHDGRVRLESDFARTSVDVVVRFYQAEELAALGCDWRRLFVGGATPVSNPACAALSESKRLPLLWNELRHRPKTWRCLLEETVDPRDASRLLRGDWVIKPAFGNEGDDVAVSSAMTRAAWARRVLRALAQPERWIAQRRFEPVPLSTPLGSMNACIGVYVVDGEVCGAYGRLTPSAVIDCQAMDAAVLVADGPDDRH